MLKLKLNLSIRHPGFPPIETGCRVFDRYSYRSCLASIKAGNFGRVSKGKYYLTGVVMMPSGDWEAVDLPLFVNAYGNPDVWTERKSADSLQAPGIRQEVMSKWEVVLAHLS